MRAGGIEGDVVMANLPRTASCIESGMAQGLHVGAQLHVILNSRESIDLAMGIARPRVAMAPDTLMLWQSSTKPVAAVAIGQLWERGALTLDDRVARFIPEFAAGGKEAFNRGHLLRH